MAFLIKIKMQMLTDACKIENLIYIVPIPNSKRLKQ